MFDSGADLSSVIPSAWALDDLDQRRGTRPPADWRPRRVDPVEATAPWPSGVLDEHGARVEQVEALSLRVLLRSRSRLSRDHGDVAAGGRGVRQAGGQ